MVRSPRKASFLQEWGCELTRGDLLEPDSLVYALEGQEAVIDAAIPHPTEALHRHDLLEASTALPEAIDTTVHAQGQKNLVPVQPHENRHQRRASSKPHHEEEAMIAGHGFGDHLPAFLRRPVRLPAGDRRTGK